MELAELKATAPWVGPRQVADGKALALLHYLLDQIVCSANVLAPSLAREHGLGEIEVPSFEHLRRNVALHAFQAQAIAISQMSVQQV